MSKKQSVLARLLILIVALLAATGCYRGVRVGDLQTTSQTIERDGADAVNVNIEMGAGELDVSGGASELLEATFTYNVAELNPRATYTGGTLEVKEASGVRIGSASLADLDEYRNEWDLRLNEDVPMAMVLNLGAGPANLTLGALNLTNLDINAGAGHVDLNLDGSQSLRRLEFDAGAGEVTIDLSGDWQNDLDARISGGLGNLNLRLPGDVGVSIRVETGVGSVDASGLSRDGDTYTNDAYGVSDVTLHIDINGGVGRINLDVES